MLIILIVEFQFLRTIFVWIFSGFKKDVKSIHDHRINVRQAYIGLIIFLLYSYF